MRFCCCLLLLAPFVVADVCLEFGEIELPPIALSNVPFSAQVSFQAAVSAAALNPNGSYTLEVKTMDQKTITTSSFGLFSSSGVQTTEKSIDVSLPAGRTEFEFVLTRPEHCAEDGVIKVSRAELRVVPAGLSILPPLATLIVAIATRHVIFALYIGVWIGCLLLYDYNPITAFARSLDTKIPGAIADTGHAVVLLFSWMLVGMVAVIGKSGGAQGLANRVIRRAKTSSAGQFSAWAMGLLVFFDDYANVLIVGNSIRPVTDRLRVSREKLAFIVDCTSAPIASIAPVSSWIGFELSLITDEFKNINLDKSAYMAFLQTIPLRFYPMFLLAFVVAVFTLQRDFGPMWKAEDKARRQDLDEAHDGNTINNELLEPKKGVELKWYNAAIPIGSVIILMFSGLLLDGYYTLKDSGADSFSFKDLFIASDSFRVLMWCGAIAIFVPVVLYAVQGIMTPKETTSIWIEGMKELMEPVLILTLAWTLGGVIKELKLSQWLIESLQDSISPTFLPTIIFLFSSLISFCTGSSWSTMTIMFPIVVPLAWSVTNKDYDGLVQSIASVLAGSVFGDHCSPISDTTVLSALATRCSVEAHVTTQIPYALTVAAVSILIGTLPVATDSAYSEWIALPLGIAFLWGLLYFIGKPISNFNIQPDETYSRTSTP